MAGVLKIIATPIGNLSDLSPRAVQALKECHVILAESISHSRKLLSSIGLDLKHTRLISCSATEEMKRVPQVLELLEQGQSVGLISDAGAPAVSDPGARLIQAAIESDYRVEPIPGPSAVITALMGAGLITHRFAFLGFLPKKGKERIRLIQDSYQAGLALVIFESPHRISKTLAELFELCGSKKVVVARELTKLYETFHRGSLGSALKPSLIEKGEFVIIIEACIGSERPIQKLDIEPAQGSKAKAKQLAGKLGISTREAYQRILTGAK